MRMNSDEKSPTRLLFVSLLALGLSVAGCNRSGHHDHAHAHAHAAPHGGALVELGEEAAHLEFVLDPATGRLDAYVLDAHVENFVRIAQPTIELELQWPGGSRRAIALLAVANPATGETAGDTAQFSAGVSELTGVAHFDGVVKTITVRGVTHENIAFSFPEGSAGH